MTAREVGSAIAIRDERHYLATVAEVRALAERIENVEEARDLADRARAAQVWAQRAKLGQEQVNLAGIAKLWAERRAGELLRDSGFGEHGGDRKSSSAPRLETVGITKHESSRFQGLAEIPSEDFQAAIEVAAEEGAVSRARVMAVHYSSETSEWSTPQQLFDLLDSEFRFDLDVCATPENAKCSRYFTAEHDGLAQEWTGTCWMNPPYGSVIGDWVRKAREAAQAGSTVVCLLPARVDTAWWWNHARFGEVRFLRGRLRFGGGDTGAPFPSAIVIFGRPASVVWWESWPTV